MNPFAWSFRAQCLLGLLTCIALLGFALYTQFVGGLMPCPLCTFQRGAFILLGLVFLAGAVHGPKSRGGRVAYAVPGLLAGGLGLLVAGRHVWMQHLPADKVPACGPDLNFMMQAFPMGEVVRRVFTGSGECALVDWTLLGLSMPQWSLLWFVLLTAWALFVGLRPRHATTP